MKKILFNDNFLLTQAVLDGRKTQTRRIVPQSLIDKYEEWYDDVCCIAMPSGSTIETIKDWLLRKHTRYNVGEVVAVAQSYKDAGIEDVTDKDGFLYHTFTIAAYDNKMFVRADLMPHQIRITDVRVERLQDISDENCLKKGVRKVVNENGIYIQYYVGQGNNACSFENPRNAFAHLINKVSRKDVWSQNPYVFVYDFELVTHTI